MQRWRWRSSGPLRFWAAPGRARPIPCRNRRRPRRRRRRPPGLGMRPARQTCCRHRRRLSTGCLPHQRCFRRRPPFPRIRGAHRPPHSLGRCRRRTLRKSRIPPGSWSESSSRLSSRRPSNSRGSRRKGDQRARAACPSRGRRRRPFRRVLRASAPARSWSPRASPSGGSTLRAAHGGQKRRLLPTTGLRRPAAQRRRRSSGRLRCAHLSGPRGGRGRKGRRSPRIPSHRRPPGHPLHGGRIPSWTNRRQRVAGGGRRRERDGSCRLSRRSCSGRVAGRGCCRTASCCCRLRRPAPSRAQRLGARPQFKASLPPAALPGAWRPAPARGAPIWLGTLVHLDGPGRASAPGRRDRQSRRQMWCLIGGAGTIPPVSRGEGADRAALSSRLAQQSAPCHWGIRRGWSREAANCPSGLPVRTAATLARSWRGAPWPPIRAGRGSYPSRSDWAVLHT